MEGTEVTELNNCSYQDYTHAPASEVIFVGIDAGCDHGLLEDLDLQRRWVLAHGAYGFDGAYKALIAIASELNRRPTQRHSVAVRRRRPVAQGSPHLGADVKRASSKSLAS